MTEYDERLSVRDARQKYFSDNGFDGSYNERWVKLKAGPFTFVFPNAAGRVRAVKLHDLHHVVTGYQTTWTGEGEIAAWEIASGCGSFAWAWLLNLQAFLIGAVIAPGDVWRAFLRGRRSRSLYRNEREPTAEILGCSVGELRHRLRLDTPPARGDAADLFAFAICVVASAIISLGLLAALIYLLVRLV